MVDTVVVAPNGASGSPLAGVSWPAIVAGAVAACAITLVLLAFGTGLGLSQGKPSLSLLESSEPATDKVLRITLSIGQLTPFRCFPYQSAN
jgi:hypothetical protein